MKETVIKVSNCRECPLYRPIYPEGEKKVMGCNYTKAGWYLFNDDGKKNPECKVIEVIVKEED